MLTPGLQYLMGIDVLLQCPSLAAAFELSPKERQSPILKCKDTSKLMITKPNKERKRSRINTHKL